MAQKRGPVRSGAPSPRYVGCIRKIPTNRTAGTGNSSDATVGASTVFGVEGLRDHMGMLWMALLGQGEASGGGVASGVYRG